MAKNEIDKDIINNRQNFAAEFIVTGLQAGSRLDAALATAFSHLGVRARRRLWNTHDILIDNKPAKAGYELKAGQQVTVKIKSNLYNNSTNTNNNGCELSLLKTGTDYCCFFKPDGLASASIAVTGNYSAEQYISENWQNICNENTQLNLCSTPPLLCNRLDSATSGLLLGAFSMPALNTFKRFEEQGQVNKYYYAFVHGNMPAPLTMRNKLETDNRKKTLCLPEDGTDFTRYTFAEPLAFFNTGPVADCLNCSATLLRVQIKRGARHQIRAHLAYAGFPIIGDTLYSNANSVSGQEHMYLHHYKLEFTGFEAEYPPLWAVWKNVKI
ncbi:hypothetical protein LJB93_00710 [Desulfovibrio sp. OttesenSCG-928-F07]|nr:hypothetical protein [Desulfovibrio sp. OttesenSCG-928-F07]